MATLSISIRIAQTVGITTSAYVAGEYRTFHKKRNTDPVHRQHVLHIHVQHSISASRSQPRPRTSMATRI